MQADNNTERLEQIWKQGKRGVAVAFLRRVMQPQTSLAEIQEALQFAEVKDLIGTIRLSEVLGALPAVEPTSRPAAAVAPSPVRPASRRTRRGPAQMNEIKGQLWQMLCAEPGSLDTTQLHEGLAQSGHEIDRITLKRLLSLLEGENKITCLGGRPKAWRRVQGSQSQSNSIELS
ncbi:MAG: hypothetical protein EOO40_01855 [Deltaproteobacteria bacterium]|nr:MAG: hypothetical protein EOO40_01855 [Deltaproteobacteria bacterium]